MGLWLLHWNEGPIISPRIFWTDLVHNFFVKNYLNNLL